MSHRVYDRADVVSQLSKIMNLLNVMRVDMTNYAIRQIRPLVQKQHIQQQAPAEYLITNSLLLTPIS